jgi:hypothetical protein
MAAVNKDRDDGLDPDTARMWKEQVHEIAVKVRLDQPSERVSGSKSGPVAHSGTADRLAPLKSIIEQATYTMQAAAREITDPDETILRGFGKQLGNSKKEIMTISKDLVVGQPADVAMEATRLASEACNDIKASIRAQPPPSARPVMGSIDPEWAAGSRPVAPAWFQRPPQVRPAAGNAEPGWPSEARPVASGWPTLHTPAATAWPPTEPLPRPRIKGEGGELSALMRGMMNAQANDSGWPTFSGKYVEYPRFRKEWWAYRQTDTCATSWYAAVSRRGAWPATSDYW